MKNVGLILFILVGILLGQTNLEKGLAAFTRRAEGSRENIAKPEAINEAIEYYNLSLSDSDPEIDAVIGLLKSYYFKGKFVAQSENHKKIVFDKAKTLALPYIEKYPNRADIRYWYLTNLGSWAEVYGILTAAKEGVADQMREHALKIIFLDYNYEDGGGYLLLGAVHYKSPYIPFLRSWPNNKEALKFLEKAVNTGEATAVQRVYLAQALYKGEKKVRALTLLNEVANMVPDKNDTLSDWEQIKKARSLLKDYK